MAWLHTGDIATRDEEGHFFIVDRRKDLILTGGFNVHPAEIIEHCRPRLAAYKLPRSVRFVPDLPKTSTGKVMRRELGTLDS